MKPCLQWRFPRAVRREQTKMYLDAIGDSDWASKELERKSSTCVVMRVGESTLETSSTTQGVIALSSGEVEFYASARAAACGLQLKHFFKEVQFPVELRVWSDSTASRGMMSRHGSGRVKHLEIRSLWTQEALERGDFTIHKSKTEENVADIGTNTLPGDRIEKLITALGMAFLDSSGKPVVIN